MEWPDLSLRITLQGLGYQPGGLAGEPRWHGQGPRPALDVYETATHLVVVVELAGVTRDALEVVAEGGALLIRGRRADPAPAQAARRHRLEIGAGPFELAVGLPGPADFERARAELRDGRLSVTLPKVAPVAVRLPEGHHG